MPVHTRPYDSVLDLIGWTPLIRLHRVTEGIRTPVYGKARVHEPGGLCQGPDRSRNHRGRRGCRRAPAGRHHRGGYQRQHRGGARPRRHPARVPLHLHHPGQDEPGEGAAAQGIRRRGDRDAHRRSARSPGQLRRDGASGSREETPNAILADQFYNQANPEAHYRTTGPEIWEQTEGRITHFVSAAGTGGTITGVGRYLKERNPAIRIIGGDPVGSIIRGYAETGAKGEASALTRWRGSGRTRSRERWT